MATIQKTRQYVKPVRSSYYYPPLTGCVAGMLVIEMTSGSKVESDGYHVTAMPSDWGRAFRLEKFEVCGGEAYDVMIDGDFGHCECMGHVRHRHCKHVDTLRE